MINTSITWVVAIIISFVYTHQLDASQRKNGKPITELPTYNRDAHAKQLRATIDTQTGQWYKSKACTACEDCSPTRADCHSMLTRAYSLIPTCISIGCAYYNDVPEIATPGLIATILSQLCFTNDVEQHIQLQSDQVAGQWYNAPIYQSPHCFAAGVARTLGWHECTLADYYTRATWGYACLPSCVGLAKVVTSPSPLCAAGHTTMAHAAITCAPYAAATLLCLYCCDKYNNPYNIARNERDELMNIVTH